MLASSIFGTNSIEGGTLSEEETAAILERPVQEIRLEEERRVSNIKQAYAKAEEGAEPYELHKNRLEKGKPLARLLTEPEILEIHRLMTLGLHHKDNTPGQYRDNPKQQKTRVSDSDHGGVYVPPTCRQDIDIVMRAFFQWINEPPVIDLPPLLRAPLAHLYFELIHPFWDGNGRVGRVLEAMVLKTAGFKYAPFAMARYYLDHIDEYFLVFNLARKSAEKKEPHPNSVFVRFFLEGMLKVIQKLHKQASAIIGFLLYESELVNMLRDNRINQRQYAISMQILNRGAPITLKQLRAEPWYRALYEKLTEKTRNRDFKRLLESGLLAMTANQEIVPEIPGR